MYRQAVSQPSANASPCCAQPAGTTPKRATSSGPACEFTYADRHLFINLGPGVLARNSAGDALGAPGPVKQHRKAEPPPPGGRAPGLEENGAPQGGPTRAPLPAGSCPPRLRPRSSTTLLLFWGAMPPHHATNTKLHVLSEKALVDRIKRAHPL